MEMSDQDKTHLHRHKAGKIHTVWRGAEAVAPAPRHNLQAEQVRHPCSSGIAVHQVDRVA
jgi:hypothetical protein